MTAIKMRLFIKGKCRIYDCDNPAEAVIIFKSEPLFFECHKHAKEWEKVNEETIAILYKNEVKK